MTCMKLPPWILAVLGCEDVLYLDGDISNMLVNPPADAKLTPNTFAGMFYVAE